MGRVAMDFLEHRYYRLNRKIMTLLGQWPSQRARSSHGILAVILFVLMTGLPPPILAMVRHSDDPTSVVEIAYKAFFMTISVMKWFISILWNTQKTWKLLNRICTNWQVWVRCREVNILHEYAERGKKMAIIYTGLSISLAAAAYSSNLLAAIPPMIPKIIDIVLKNGTEIGKFQYPVDYYFFDAQEYYWYINLHCYLCTCMATTLFVASDSMLIIYVQHVCGIFAALGHQLEQIGNNKKLVENGAYLSSLIDRHNDAIKYANLIEETYTWNLFFTIGLGMILFNILGLQILMNSEEPEIMIRCSVIMLCLLMVFYGSCSLSQITMDHSVNICFYIYNSQWYRLLPKDQKLLQFMIIRCRVPCQLTAGYILIMSMEFFLLTVRTAMSYFAVVRPR